MITLILTLAARGAIGTRPADAPDDKGHLLVFHPDGTATDALIGELKGQLGLDLTRDIFRFAPRIAGRKPNEVGIQTRSLLAMMQFLSKGVEVPQADTDQSTVVEYFAGIGPKMRRTLVPMTR